MKFNLTKLLQLCIHWHQYFCLKITLQDFISIWVIYTYKGEQKWLDKLESSQSSGAVEYIDCIYAEWGDKSSLSSNECPGYDTKLSNGEAPVMLEFGECGVPLRYHCFHVHSHREW